MAHGMFDIVFDENYYDEYYENEEK